MAKFVHYESCQSCKSCFKNKHGIGMVTKSLEMCVVDRKVETKDHVNQNGHVVKKVVAVRGVEPCIMKKPDGAYKCRRYSRNFRKPLAVREV